MPTSRENQGRSKLAGNIEHGHHDESADRKIERPAFLPTARQIDLTVDAPRVFSVWSDDVSRRADVQIFDRLPTWETPGVVSLPVSRPSVAVQGFAFGEAAAGEPASDVAGLFDRPPRASTPDRVQASRPETDTRKATRIRPPRDVIKLEDRLYYVLQPPLETILNTASLSFPFPPFPYQFEGIAFLYPRHEAILADEMGLGKTMQAITTIRLLVRTGQLRRVLLVCPKPLVTNWQREFALWAPELPLTIIEGDQARREWQWQVPEAIVTIANYEILLRDQQQIADAGWTYDLMVLDESQRIKNRSSATSRAVRAVARTRSWAMTGTPVENSQEDLVGIFEFVRPGTLHSDMRPRRMGQAANDYIIRRTKDQVMTDLPPKLFRDADVELTPAQRTTYDLAEQAGEVRLSEMGDRLAIGHVFELILRLKQICNFDPATGTSAKMERLEADLTECVQSGRKAIVFSQWVETLTQLRDRLGAYRPLEYHGRIPSSRRDAVIERFRDDDECHVLLMSYGAGSVGLNLQFAQYVFLFDRWWNPAVEDQAINRAHRIGTAGPVTITRFTSLNTIEERIQRILEEKRELFDTILSGTTPARSIGLSRREIFSLFNLPVTDDAVENDVEDAA